MKNSLFWRLFWAFLGALTATVAVLALIMVTLVRAERRLALENEVRVQARDLAQLTQQYLANAITTPSGFLFGETGALYETLAWKIGQVHADYDAQVSVTLGADTVVRARVFNQSGPAVDEALGMLAGGASIRVLGVFNESSQILTIGVPFLSPYSKAMGGVLVHVSLSALAVDYTDIVRYALIACAAALMVGTLLSYLIARRQVQPLRDIQRALSALGEGRFERLMARGDAETVQLIESFNRMAEQLSNLEASRRAFVANVSHELRSPMTSIGGYVQGILDGTISQRDQHRYLSVVRDEMWRLTKLVNELLALSRYESGKSTLDRTRFDLCALILKVMFEYERRIEDKKIEVEIAFREQPIPVMADSDRIVQVVSNLVDNAVKFTEEEGHIRVRAEVQGEKASVVFQNSGPGIPRDDLPFVFERFYKSDKAHTAGMGTGLGLAIVRTILKQHGEDVAVTSVIGETRFSFTLPYAPGPDGDLTPR